VAKGTAEQALIGMPVLRLGLVISAVIAVPAVALGAVLAGGAGAAGALVGIAVVAGFFSIGKLAVAVVARRAPHLLLPAALGTYTGQIGLLGVLLLALNGVEAIHLLTLAWTVFVGVFGWMGAELWVATHTRVPFFDPAAFAARQAALAQAGRPTTADQSSAGPASAAAEQGAAGR
jgi:ATP synthase protein I